MVDTTRCLYLMDCFYAGDGTEKEGLRKPRKQKNKKERIDKEKARLIAAGKSVVECVYSLVLLRLLCSD